MYYSLHRIIHHHIPGIPGGQAPTNIWIHPLLLKEDILQSFIAGICIPEVGLLREHKRSNYSITGRHVMHNLTWHFVMNNPASNLPFNHTTYHISFRSKDVFQNPSCYLAANYLAKARESVFKQRSMNKDRDLNFPCSYFEFTCELHNVNHNTAN